MKTLLSFLGLVMPQLGPVLLQLPELGRLFHSAFTRVGGTDAQLKAVLAANKIDIDRLANPDSFRRRRPSEPPPPPPGPPYLTVMEPPIPDDDALLLLGYQIGDRVAGNGESPQWMMVKKGSSLLGAKVIRVIGGEG